jgi:hypothetical protein
MSSTKNGRPVRWLSTKHGDRVTLNVSNEDQRNGIPGSPHNCAVVQTVVRSSPDVYDAEVSEGNMKIWVHGEQGRDWRGRLIMDKNTRELAIKYDDGKLSAPTTITLIVDKWYEVRHYKRTRKPIIASTSSPELEGESEVQSEDEIVHHTGVDEQTEIVEQELVQKKRRQRRSSKNRWDISGYLIPANVE